MLAFVRARRSDHAGSEQEAARCRGRVDALEAIQWPDGAPFADRDKAGWDAVVREASLKVDGRKLERFPRRNCERALRCGWQFDAPERRRCAADGREER